MEQLVIKSAGGTIIPLFSREPVCSVTQAVQYRKLLGEDTVTLTVKSAARLNIEIGATILAFGEEYTLNLMPLERKELGGTFSYNLTFEGPQYALLRGIYYNTDASGFNNTSQFPLIGDLSVFMGVLMNNISRVLGSSWSLGTVAPSATKTITFAGENCLAALQKICQEFDTEFEIIRDASGHRTISLKKVGQILSHTFEYGRAGGLYSLERQGVSSDGFATRLYVYGSTKNLPVGYRNYSTRLQTGTPGSYIEDGNAIAAFGLIEGEKIYEDIFPEYFGNVSGLGTDLLSFSDGGMNFDLSEVGTPPTINGRPNYKYFFDGVAGKIHFNTGNLAGYEFNIKSYTHSTQTFVILPFKDERGQDFPAAGAFSIAVGDTYVILDIDMPQGYVDQAEAKLLAAGQAEFAGSPGPRVQYKLDVTEEYIAAQAGAGSIVNFFSLGDYVTVLDTDININKASRIISFRRDLLSPYKYTLDLADSYDVTLIERIIAAQQAIKTIIRINNLTSDGAKARNGWRTTQELLNMLFDQDGYFTDGRIKPLSIETEMLVVGAKSQQFILNIVFEPNYQGNANLIHSNAGSLTHYTIEETIRTWHFNALTVTIGDNNARYVYAVCNITNYNDATISYSTAQVKVDGNPGYYTFLLGVLHSVDTSLGGLGVRWISLTYGATAINGRFIKTGRIQSFDGQTYFDLDLGEIGGKITFVKTDGSTGDVGELSDNFYNFVDNTFDDYATAVKTQLDGKIESFFGSNNPATWPPAEYSAHVGDMWYNTNLKMLFRFDGSGPDGWIRVEDADALAAYEQAAMAQDTADGKRRVFLVEPYAPYDAGDLWVGGPSGEILVCVTPKAVGQAFAFSDWHKASRYTGDEALVSFVEGTFTDYATTIKAQLDGKIESFFGSVNPAGGWAPADYAAHAGDMWYNTAFKQLFRFGGADPNDWHRVEDADAVAAYENALKAQDTADGKRRVFLTTPYPPYDAGDLWVQGASGDILVCINPKVVGQAYAVGDFVKGSKYTGDEALVNFVQNTYNPTTQAYQTQLDGKIESFFGPSNPATWPSGDYAKHVGDMWYNTSIKKLFRFGGADPNDWSLIEDAAAIAAYELASQAKDAVDGKRTVFIVTPYPPYAVGDLWVDGTHLRNCITARLAGQFFDINDWVYSTAYDKTKTVIDGGIVTSGTIQLAGSQGSVLAGITGADDGPFAIRIWAGASFENRYSAPFRVNQLGEVVGRRKIEVQDENNVGQAGLAGSMQPSDGIIRIWAGVPWANRESAPWRVDANGWMFATRGYIGNLQIANGYLTNNGSGDSGVVISNNATQKTAAIGTAVVSTTTGLNPVAYFSNKMPAQAYDDNYGAIFEASGAGKNFAIFAPTGTSAFREALINGRRIKVLSNESDANMDASLWDGVVCNPGTGISNIAFTAYSLGIYDGKEFTALNDGTSTGKVILRNIQRGNANLELPIGWCVTLVFLRGQWYVKSFWGTQY